MKEYMLLVRNEIDQQASWTPDQHQLFLHKCEDYIRKLTLEGKLLSAQPLVRDGIMLSGTTGAWEIGPFHEAKEVIVGYYHINAENIDEAISIAQQNPEFAFGTTARIEVRPIMMKEDDTGFVYPRNA